MRQIIYFFWVVCVFYIVRGGFKHVTEKTGTFNATPLKVTDVPSFIVCYCA